MIKRIMLFLILPSLLFGQIGNWKSKTINQLSGIVSGTTNIGSKSYWETKAYAQIHDIIDRIDKIQYATDYTSLANAMTGLSDSSGGKLILPAKTYSITAALTIGNNYCIEGEGYGSLIDLTKSAATSLSIINIDSDTNVVISNLRILGDTTNAYALQHDHAIRIKNSKNVFIIGCYLDFVGGDGVYIDSSSNVFIIGNYMTNHDYGGGSGHAGTFDYGRHGIACISGENIVVANNFISNGYGGIDFEATSNDTIRRIVISGNVIKNVRESIAVQAVTSNSYAEDISIYGNIIRDAYVRGIWLRGGKDSDGTYGRRLSHATISNNVVDSTLGGYGITIEASEYISVIGNEVRNTVPSAFNASDSSRYFSVIGNTFCNSDAYGLGIAACDTFSVIGNILSTNASGQVVNSGNRGYMWMGNIGYNYFMTDNVISMLRTSESQAHMDLAQKGTAEFGAVLKLWGRGNTINDTNYEIFQINYPDTADIVISNPVSGTGTKRNVRWALPGDTEDFFFADSAANAMVRVTGDYIFSLDHAALDLGTVQTFIDSDATPDVTGRTYWKTNTTTFTITDFDGTLVDGQVIVVISKGAITYDVTSSGIIGGTTDIITAAGDVTTFMYDGTDWYVIARMDLSDDLN